MITRDPDDRDTFLLDCDVTGCAEQATFATNGNFRAMVEAAKAEGWAMQRQGDTWYHKCPHH